MYTEGKYNTTRSVMFVEYDKEKTVYRFNAV